MGEKKKILTPNFPEGLTVKHITDRTRNLLGMVPRKKTTTVINSYLIPEEDF